MTYSAILDDANDKIANDAEKAEYVGPNVVHDEALRPKSREAYTLDNTDGIVEYLNYDEGEKRVTHEILQDAQPILDVAKEMHNSGHHGSNEFRLAGEFPVTLVNEWLRLRNMTMRDFKGDVVKDFLNDPSHKYFRIWPGRV